MLPFGVRRYYWFPGKTFFFTGSHGDTVTEYVGCGFVVRLCSVVSDALQKSIYGPFCGTAVIRRPLREW